MLENYASITFPTTHFFHPPYYFVNFPNVSNPTLSKFPSFYDYNIQELVLKEWVAVAYEKFLCRQNKKEIC